MAQGISFSYKSNQVLEDISFTVNRGEFIGIIGPNGGGKTTLLRLMLGYLRPDKGSIRILNAPPAQTRLHVGYMPQYSKVNEDIPLTVEQIAAMGLFHDRHLLPRISSQTRKLVSQTLEMVSLEQLRKVRFAELSGGQRQRTLLARAVVSSPQILFLDEPTASVDNRVEKDIYEYLKRLNGSMTILLVSHDIGIVSSMVDRVMCLNRKAVLHRKEELTGEHVAKDLYQHDSSIISHSCGL